VSEFVYRNSGVVAIRENHPFVGRVTIYYTPPQGFVARQMEVPAAAFIDACTHFADRMAVRRDRAAKRVEQPIASTIAAARPAADGAVTVH
jgi:hypothetical protein